MTGVVPLIPRIKFTLTSGVPAALGWVTVYQAGTTTLTNSWQDKAQTTLNTNPIHLDANGECLLWLDSAQTYKLLLQDVSLVTVSGWPVDNIPGGADTGAAVSAASDWATKTDAAVSGSLYSAKEYAQGTQLSTGGSAKNWAQQTGADVTGASANSRSAKSWSQDNLTGATLGGSAKDWAQSASLPDGTLKSAKSYATDAQTASDVAAAASRIYASTAAGLAGTTNGQYFYVVSATSTQSLLLYLNNAGSAVLQKTLVSADGAALYSAQMAAAGNLLKFNLYDADAATTGQLIDATTGATSANALYTATGYIPVQPGVAIKHYPASAAISNPYGMAWYDRDRTYISGTAAPFTSGQSFTPPATAYYARFCIRNTSLSSAMILPGSITATVVADHTPADVGDVSNVFTEAATFASLVRARAKLNMYDKELRATGTVVAATDGTTSANATYFTTAYMPVIAAAAYKIYPASSAISAPFGLAWYDRDFVYISGTSGPFTSGQSVTAPASACYARICVNNNQVDSFIFLPSAITAGDVMAHTVAVKADFRQWAGKTFMQLGDSISANTNWMADVATYLGVSTMTNNSLSGRKMVDALKTPGGVALVSGDFTSVDQVNLFLGTNDYSGGTTFGSISDSTATASFYGQAKLAIETMLGWKPTLRITLTTMLYRTGGTTLISGKTIRDFSAAIREIAQFYGLDIFDAERVSGWNSLTIATYSGDGLHPNTAGYTAGLINPAKAFYDGVQPAT